MGGTTGSVSYTHLDVYKRQAATPPNDGSGSTYNQYDFAFDRLGVRVPAIVVSPLIEAGVVDHTVYDHSSVPATMERLFGFGPLTARDAAANDVRHLFTLTSARTDLSLIHI